MPSAFSPTEYVDTDRIRSFTKTIPFATTVVTAVCWLIVIISLFTGFFIESFSLIPENWPQVWRLLTHTLVHAGFIHVLVNSFGWIGLGTLFERQIGTVQMFYFTFALSFLTGVTYLVLAGFTSLIMTTTILSTAVVGISGLIFTLITIEVNTMDPDSSRSIFGLVSVPALVYPWLSLLLIQLIFPGASFCGHLSGILVGYMYCFGWLNPLLLSESTIRNIEESQAFQPLTRSTAFVLYQNNGLRLPEYQDPRDLVGKLGSFKVGGNNANNGPTSLASAVYEDDSQRFPGAGHRLNNGNNNGSNNEKTSLLR